MRVPATLAEVKNLLETTISMMQPLIESYHYVKVTSDYAGVVQRWLVIHSEAARTRAKKSVGRQVFKMTVAEHKAFEKLSRQDFAGEQDAERALIAFQQELKVLSVHDVQVIEVLHCLM